MCIGFIARRVSLRCAARTRCDVYSNPENAAKRFVANRRRALLRKPISSSHRGFRFPSTHIFPKLARPRTNISLQVHANGQHRQIRP